jgi:hypothetical protein
MALVLESMSHEQLEAEWQRCNELFGYARDEGARHLILTWMDKIAKLIDYPMSLDVYKQERKTQ